jgi:hypothetical protein
MHLRPRELLLLAYVLAALCIDPKPAPSYPTNCIRKTEAPDFFTTRIESVCFAHETPYWSPTALLQNAAKEPHMRRRTRLEQAGGN